jgi:hypothetical protein
MDTKQALETLVELLGNRTETRRTRKNGQWNETETAEHKYPNDDKSKWYKHQQFTTTHSFNCDDVTIDLLVQAIIDQIIIDDQRVGRSLSDEAFTKKYSKPVEINVKSALSKKTGATASPDKVLKQAQKLTREQQIELIKQQSASLGLSAEEFEALTSSK